MGSSMVIYGSCFFDNHDSCYLGMAVQLYVQAHLGHYHMLTIIFTIYSSGKTENNVGFKLAVRGDTGASGLLAPLPCSGKLYYVHTGSLSRVEQSTARHDTAFCLCETGAMRCYAV